MKNKNKYTSKFGTASRTVSYLAGASQSGVSKTVVFQSDMSQSGTFNTASPYAALFHSVPFTAGLDQNETLRTTASPFQTEFRPHLAVVFILFLITALFFLVGCKTKHTITETTTIKTDSTAFWNLNDSLYKKETLVANLQIDLQHLRDENIRLLNETSTHLISYDTAAPVNPETGKPPIVSESFTVSKSTLEEIKKEYEALLQSASIENQTLSQQNRNLQLTVEKLTNENKQLTEKTTSPGFNLKLFLFGLFLGLILLLLNYFFIKKK